MFDGLVTRWRAKPRAVFHVLSKNFFDWIVAVDAADTSIGPGCFFHNLDAIVAEAGEEAEVVVKDPSPLEDSNGGVFVLKNAEWGHLFANLVMDKDNWPTELIGGGCYPEQMAMNEAILEMAR